MEGLSNVKPHPEWRLLVERYKETEFGVVITHHDLAVVSGLVYPSRRYYGQVAKFVAHMLKDHDRAIRPRPRVGYEVLNPNAYTERSRDETLRGRRRFRIAARISKATPMDKLTQKEAQAAANMMAYLAPMMRVLNRIEWNTRPANLLRSVPDMPKLLLKK